MTDRWSPGRRVAALKWVAAIELAFGIFVTPFFMDLLVCAVHVSLLLTWTLVIAIEQVLVKLGWIQVGGEHDKLHLSAEEEMDFADLMAHYDEEAQR